MASYEEKMKELEEELRKTPYNKRTQHHIGLVKAKIARLREKLEVKISSKAKGKGYTVKKSGDATIALVGFPSVGKSTLLNKLTNAESKIAEYDFTTITCIPGIMEYKSAKMQILDIPGLISGASAGAGHGREVISVIRNSDLILIMVDAQKPEQLNVIKKELYNANIRLDQKRPDVKIRPVIRGGISINSTSALSLSEETIGAVLREFKINNAEVTIREGITIDQLIDVIEGNRCYVLSVVVLNKVDLVSNAENIANQISAIPISAENGVNIDFLKEEIFRKLDFIKIFLKQVGRKADLQEPMIIKNGATIRNVCEKIHRDFIAEFRFARIWGKSAAFPGQKVGLEHKLIDGGVVQIHLR